ncbi:uncharacterized protein LOC125239448 isoform X2 [Leguminivora glycinivorella]|uniref:uncharacterized protein LOC125239448 isoform X2 n=1 Tax=Leguminivora glycinivorella TaxID=1035111 RepID=UPI00200CF01E|nr:uncharacterized protein LOC125239448 isoform X2 [Leguminivora glycinivorella]
MVLLSVSMNTSKGIHRIPVNARFRGRSGESDNSEEVRMEVEDDNPQIEITLSPLEINDTNDDVSLSTEIKAELKFTDFVLEAAKVLKTYKNNVLEQAFAILDDEVWKDVYKGCKPNELGDIRKYASDKLGQLKDAPAETLRQHLDDIINVIRNEEYGEIKDLVEYMNSLYVGETDKFIEALLALVHIRISDDVDLADIIKGALKYFLFDHYCNLDDTVRHELMKMIKHYWRQFISQLVNNDIRSHKVFSGRSLALRIGQKGEQNEENPRHGENGINMRAGSGEIAEERFASIEWNGNDDTTRDKIAALKTNDEISRFLTSFSQSERKPKFRGGQSTIADKINGQSNSNQHNNTIERLINIGNLAKEINDMMRPDNKNLRHGPMFMNLDTLFGMDFLGYTEGGEPTTTEVTKKAKADDKSVIITMNAKYGE